MENVIRKISEIMGPENLGSQLTLSIFSDKGIVFGIYEQEIPIVIDRENKIAYVDCETTSSQLTSDMLDELTQITKLIQENIDTVLKCVE